MAKAARTGNLTPEQIVARAEALGARVELRGLAWRVFPPDPDQPAVTVPRRVSYGRSHLNTVTALRRVGLDVTAPPPDQRPDQRKDQPTMPTPTPATLAARRANGAVHPSPTALDEVRQQLQTVLEMLAEADTRDTARQAALDELRTELATVQGDCNRLRADLNRTRTDLARLGREMTAGGVRADPNAALDAAIHEFMASTPVKLTAAVIAANIGMEVSGNQVGKRLQALAAAGRVVHVDGPGSAKVYRLPEEPRP